MLGTPRSSVRSLAGNARCAVWNHSKTSRACSSRLGRRLSNFLEDRPSSFCGRFAPHGGAVDRRRDDGSRRLRYGAPQRAGPTRADTTITRRRGNEARASTGSEARQASAATSPGSSAPMPGHSNAAESNALYRGNLAKGQTGLSVAFDLPTQTGYDPDHRWPAARSARSACPIGHLGDMRTLFDGHPARPDEHLDDHQRHGRRGCWRSIWRSPRSRARRAPACRAPRRTTSSRNISSRGTYIFPPRPALRLTTDMIAVHDARTCRNGTR